jgi:hypothetical protein
MIMEKVKSQTEQSVTSVHKLQWREYEVQIDLYKYYMDMCLKVNAFFYVIAGGILSFYFLNYTRPFVRYSLLLPILISFVLGGVFFYGASKWERVVRMIREGVNGLELVKAPDIQILYILLRVSGIIFFVVGIAMLVLFLRPLQ